MPSSIETSDLSHTEKIAAFAIAAEFEDLPVDVVEKAKSLVAYLIGLAFRGSGNEEADQMRQLMLSLTVQDKNSVSVIGERFRLRPSEAAFANTTLMRAMWRDDVMFPSGVHAGIVTLPTALAIGQLRRLSGRDLILAMVLGYEVLGKLGSVEEGWSAPYPRRPTMIFGGFGPVTVAAKMLKLDQRHFANALGYAANLGMGVTEGGQTDHFYSFISRNGVNATLLAAAGGAPYSRHTIEGELGIFRTYFGGMPTQAHEAVANLGRSWSIMNAEYKKHHGTGQSSVGIELLLSMKKANALTHRNVARIDVFLSESEAGRREHIFRGPFDDVGSALSSLPYGLAAALIHGRVTPDLFTTAAVSDRTMIDMVRRIHVRYEPRENGRYCRLEVQKTDGHRVVGASEGFMFPFPREDWGPWLNDDGKHVLPSRQLQGLEGLIAGLEDVNDITELMNLVTPPTGWPRRGSVTQ